MLCIYPTHRIGVADISQGEAPEMDKCRGRRGEAPEMDPRDIAADPASRLSQHGISDIVGMVAKLVSVRPIALCHNGILLRDGSDALITCGDRMARLPGILTKPESFGRYYLWYCGQRGFVITWDDENRHTTVWFDPVISSRIGCPLENCLKFGFDERGYFHRTKMWGIFSYRGKLYQCFRDRRGREAEVVMGIFLAAGVRVLFDNGSTGIYRGIEDVR